MSNGKEMVSITRETAKQAAHLLAAHSTGPSLERDTAEELRAALDKPAKRQQGEPVAWLTKCKQSGLVEQAEPNEKASNPEQWTDAFPVYDRGFAAGTAECETLRAQPAKRHQGDPGEVERLRIELSAVKFNLDKTDKGLLAADAEVRKLRAVVSRCRNRVSKVIIDKLKLRLERDTLRAQLAERDALLERALRLLTPNVGRFRGSVGWAVEVDRFVAAVCCSGKPSAPVGDGMHDDTEAVRAALEKKS